MAIAFLVIGLAFVVVGGATRYHAGRRQTPGSPADKTTGSMLLLCGGIVTAACIISLAA